MPALTPTKALASRAMPKLRFFSVSITSRICSPMPSVDGIGLWKAAALRHVEKTSVAMPMNATQAIATDIGP